MVPKLCTESTGATLNSLGLDEIFKRFEGNTATSVGRYLTD